MQDIEKQADTMSGKIQKASKWSLITEVLSKLMSPVTNMVLARLLAPEAFGMVATVTMVTSLAEIFGDAWFQKYIIHHNFEDKSDLEKSTNVAFWTNIVFSVAFWVLIFCFRTPIAILVGNSGLGNAIAVAALSLPMTSFSSIQTALFRRSLNFKTLFYCRLVGMILPLVVTIPLAFVMRSYWALIIGTLAVSLSNVVLLTWHSKWRPKLYYSFNRLKNMLNFGCWTFFEQFLGWANLNIGIFIVGTLLSEYYLGLYKTSMGTVNQLLAIPINAISPVLWSSLSKFKDDKEAFNGLFFKTEFLVSIFVLPLGVGIFVYRDLVTQILLGSQWTEAAVFVGLWGLVRSLRVTYGAFVTDVFIAKGKPKCAVSLQIIDLALLIPILFLVAQKGYEPLVIARSAVVLGGIVASMILLKYAAGISVAKLLHITLPSLISAAIMGIVGFFMQQVSGNMLWQFLSVLLCVIVYFSVLFGVFRNVRHEIINTNVLKKIGKRKG